MGSQSALGDWLTHSSVKMGDPAIWKAVAMADHFEKIQKLPDKVDGCPNFRRVPGYKVYCCGQPTAAGFENALNKACGEIYPKTGKIVWVNMRQEPVVYVNGEPLCARPPNKIGEYAELGDVTRDAVKEQEVSFIKTCKERAEANGGKLKYVDIIEGMKEKFPGLVHMRIPICNSASPLEKDFDT